MSLEQKIEELTLAVQQLTGVLQTQVVGTTGGNITQAPTPAPTAGVDTVAPVQQVAAPLAAAPLGQPAAAAPAAVSPSEVAPAPAPAISFDQLQAEVTTIYQAQPTNPKIMEIINKYGGQLSSIDPSQYNNVLTELRAL